MREGCLHTLSTSLPDSINGQAGFHWPQSLPPLRTRRSDAGMSSRTCWGYGDDNGPLNWYKNFPFAQGDHQSPINIVPAEAVYNAELQTLSVAYSGCSSMSICNTGHSVAVEFEDCNDKTVISGGPLEQPYKLKQFHFHWGQKDDQRGSEHTINGRSYSGELHLVHWNSTKYHTFGEAVVEADGLAVIAVFLETGNRHAHLHRLTDALYMVKFKETQAQFKEFNPQCLLPKCRDYWTYAGSLTTPPLHESVTWIVFREPIPVSEKQKASPLRFRSQGQGAVNLKLSTERMDKFRMLLFSGETESQKLHMVDNYRPPQPLKGRTVFASFQS